MGRYTSPTANTGPPANCGQPQLGIRTGVSNKCFEQVFRTGVPNGCSERVFRTFVLGPLEAVTIGQQMVKFIIIRGLDKILFSSSIWGPVRAGKASIGRLSRNYTIGNRTVASVGPYTVGSRSTDTAQCPEASVGPRSMEQGAGPI